MKALSIFLSIIIFAILWSSFFVIIMVNNINPDLFSITICFETGLLSFWSSAKFNEWFNSKLK